MGDRIPDSSFEVLQVWARVERNLKSLEPRKTKKVGWSWGWENTALWMIVDARFFGVSLMSVCCVQHLTANGNDKEHIWIVFCCSNSRTWGIEHFSNLESPQGTILARISKVFNLNLLESNPIVQSLNTVVSLCVQIFWADSSVDLLSTVTVAVLCYAHWGTTHRKSMRSRVSASSISIPSRRNWLIEPRFAMKS